jgi:hypothetical protein
MARKSLSPIDLTAVPDGTAPLTVSSTTTVTNLNADSADNVKTVLNGTNASFYPVFVNANNATATSEALYTDSGLVYNPSSNQLSTGGDISVNGGDLLTNQTTFNLINTIATTLNIGGAATTMSIGATGSTVSFPGKISVEASSGDEGGEIFLNKAVTNTTITGGVTIDVYQNKLRFFEQGGTARGFYVDITAGGAGVGTNLAASSTVVFDNYLLNSAFDIAQRGNSVAASGSTSPSSVYTLDQWVATAPSATVPGLPVVTINQVASTANMISGYDYPYYATFVTTQPVSGSVTSAASLSQRIEDVRTLANKTVTLSFWAKISTGTNNNFTPVIEQNFGSGGSASVTNTGSAIALTTTWTRFSYTVTLGSMSGKTIGTNSYLDVRPLQLSSANWSAGLTVSIAGVKLEVNGSATSFVRNQNALASELAACQRYYWRFSGSGTTTQVSISNGAYYSTTACYSSIKHPVTMRTAPSFSVNDVTAITAYALGASKASTNIVGGIVVSKESTEITVTTSAITTNGAASMLRYPANSNNYMEFSAEI